MTAGWYGETMRRCTKRVDGLTLRRARTLGDEEQALTLHGRPHSQLQAPTGR